MGSIDFSKDREQLFQKVCEIFNKNQNEVDQDIETIQTWLRTQHHLPEIMRDSHIRNLLITNKFSVERTKPKIDMYYTIRGLIPDFYNECNPNLPRMVTIFDNLKGGVHPKLAQDLYRVYIGKITGSEFIPRDVVMAMCNAAEVRLHEDCFFYEIYIVDLSNLNLSILSKITPDFIAKSYAIYEKVYSLRVKSVHLINAPSYISKVLDLLKVILKPKIFQRISVHASDEIVREIFPIEDLPKDYGGYGPSLQEITNMMRKMVEKYQDRFDQLDKMRVDENLRPEKLVNDDILGYYGNFKKLDVD